MQSLDRSYKRASASAPAIEYLTGLTQVLQLVPAGPLARAIDALLEAREQGRRVYVFGNGGSAATASHFVCDLVKGAQVPGFRPFRAFSLTDNTPMMTAYSNDVDYSETFSRMLEALIEPDDVALAISASGNSPNLVAGLQTAVRLGARTIALLGFDGGGALNIADIAVHVPCSDYGLVEDTHAALGHAMAMSVRRALEAERAHDLIRLA